MPNILQIIWFVRAFLLALYMDLKMEHSDRVRCAITGSFTDCGYYTAWPIVSNPLWVDITISVANRNSVCIGIYWLENIMKEIANITVINVETGNKILCSYFGLQKSPSLLIVTPVPDYVPYLDTDGLPLYINLELTQAEFATLVALEKRLKEDK